MRPLPGLNALQAAWSGLNDIWLGIETSDQTTIQGSGARSEHRDGEVYQAANYSNIRRVIRILKPNPDDVIYDIGCGKGRCVCVFARSSVRRVVGIEYDAGLCETARRNAKQSRGRRSPIEIRCEDAAVADVAEGTIYFLYNPFGVETLEGVFERIQDSLRTNPRTIRVVYYNPVWKDVLTARAWLHPVGEFKTLTNRRVTFWSNHPDHPHS